MALGRFFKNRKDKTDIPSDTQAPIQDLEKAVQYAKTSLSGYPYSRTGLVKSLKFAGFSDAEAEYGADNCDADWKEQAVMSARTHLNSGAYSQSGLISQLKYAGFRDFEAIHGVLNCEADWNEQASKAAFGCMKVKHLSYAELVRHLMSLGFSEAEATYGANSCSGGQIISNQGSDADEIMKFKKLMDDGIITPDEFEAKKRQLLGL